MNANKVKGISEVSSGGIKGSFVDVRLLLTVLTTAAILAHDHPGTFLTQKYGGEEILEV